MSLLDQALNVPIVSTFVDKGIKDAQKGLKALDGTAHKLARTLGYSLSAAAVVAFGKASVKAFMADDAAARQLNNTLTNLGQGFADVHVEQFIASMQNATGVLDDVLRPAMSTLIAQTRDYAQAEKLLSIALDVSAGSGKDLQSVTTALGRAYQGNFTALAKLNVGISSTEAKTMDFTQATDKLMKTWGGSSTLDTAARRMARLKVATADAMESIGQGILQAFKNLTGTTANVEDMMTRIRNLGYVLGAEIAGLASGLRSIFTTIANMPIVKLLLGVGKGAFGIVDKLLGVSSAVKKDIAAGQAKYIANQKAITNEYKKTTAAANQTATAAKKAANAAKEKLVLDKASAVLAQAQKVFDLDRIQLQAAAMGKLTEEERARVKLKTDILDLEEAINNGNITAAAVLAQSVLNDAQLLGQLRQQMVGLSDVQDPFKAWLQTLQQMVTELSKLAQIPTVSTYALDPVFAAQLDQRDAINLARGQAAFEAQQSLGLGSAWQPETNSFYNPYQSTSSNVNIVINPAVAGLIDVIQDQSASGISPTVSRTNSSYIA